MNLSLEKTIAPSNLKKKEGEKRLKQNAKEIARLHQLLFAERDKSLLVVIQGMDSSGKDGVTREVFKYCSPMGVSAYSFGKPTKEEFAHDFLWRCHKLSPKKGHIQIFIRSHYEDILIQRVNKWISDEKVQDRISAINSFEALLQKDNNTTIVKLYLHLSKDRQREKLLERIEDPEKNWKHNPDDWVERQKWTDYRAAYQDVTDKCNKPEWNIIPADNRWYRNLMASEAVLTALRGMKPNYPTIDVVQPPTLA